MRYSYFDIVCTSFCDSGLLTLTEKKCFPMATVAIGDVSIAVLLWKNVLERRNISAENWYLNPKIIMCLRVSESVWVLVSVPERVWVCPSVPDCTWVCQTVCEGVRECQSVCECSWVCLSVPENVWVCLSVSKCVWFCVIISWYNQDIWFGIWNRSKIFRQNLTRHLVSLYCSPYL